MAVRIGTSQVLSSAALSLAWPAKTNRRPLPSVADETPVLVAIVAKVNSRSPDAAPFSSASNRCWRRPVGPQFGKFPSSFATASGLPDESAPSCGTTARAALCNRSRHVTEL